MVDQVEPSGVGAGSSEDFKECNTEVAYALLLENLKQASNLSVSNADQERALNKKANVNFRLKKQIEATRAELRSQQSSDLGTPQQQAKKQQMSNSEERQQECYLNLSLFTDGDLERCQEMTDSAEPDSTEQFIDLIQSLTNRCSTTNRELKNTLRSKQQEAQHKQRLNQRKESIDKTRNEARKMKAKTDELKTATANKAKELVGYEQQQKITMQALGREASTIQKDQKQVEVIQLRTRQLCAERYRNLIDLEEQADQIESQMEEKARLIKQKNELTNLMKTVENNVEPKRFRSTMGLSSQQVQEELLDFDGLTDPSKLLQRDLK